MNREGVRAGRSLRNFRYVRIGCRGPRRKERLALVMRCGPSRFWGAMKVMEGRYLSTAEEKQHGEVRSRFSLPAPRWMGTPEERVPGGKVLVSSPTKH